MLECSEIKMWDIAITIIIIIVFKYIYITRNEV